jgi:hypothetical protein
LNDFNWRKGRVLSHHPKTIVQPSNAFKASGIRSPVHLLPSRLLSSHTIDPRPHSTSFPVAREPPLSDCPLKMDAPSNHASPSHASPEHASPKQASSDHASPDHASSELALSEYASLVHGSSYYGAPTPQARVRSETPEGGDRFVGLEETEAREALYNEMPAHYEDRRDAHEGPRLFRDAIEHIRDLKRQVNSQGSKAGILWATLMAAIVCIQGLRLSKFLTEC